MPEHAKVFFRRLTSSRFGYLLFWVVLVTSVVYQAQPTADWFIWALATVLMVSHMLYGGYFLLYRENTLSSAVLGLLIVLSAGLGMLVTSIGSPLLWFFCVQALMTGAIIFHTYYRNTTQHVWLQEFCNYKIFIETYGFFGCIVGYALVFLFPSATVWIGLFTLGMMVRLNWLIFVAKKLYQTHYSNPVSISNPLVSIVIIAYNEEQYIGKLLESLCVQIHQRLEVIVVDDHSKDKTIEIVETFKNRLAVQVVQKEVRGASRSRNYGATLATGDLLLFLDADIIVPPNFLITIINEFNQKQLAIAGVDFVPITSNSFDRWYTTQYRRWLRLVQFFNPRAVGACLLTTPAFHRQVLFDESIVMSEDFEYVKRACQLGKFRIISNCAVQTSWRRFDHENRFLLLLKYLCFEWYRQHVGEIRKNFLGYKFGHYGGKTEKVAKE
jgi:hypothetical protein